MNTLGPWGSAHKKLTGVISYNSGCFTFDSLFKYKAIKMIFTFDAQAWLD